MRLSGRLKEICLMAPSCDTLIDVGTDHAKVPIMAVLSEKAKRAKACDIEKGPLSIAKKNIGSAGLSDRIECILTDGLIDVDVYHNDVIVICGMGGESIRDILETSLDKAKTAKALVLGPHRHSKDLLDHLSENGFLIDEEKELSDKGKAYILIRAHFGGAA